MDVVSSTTAPASKRKDPPVEVLATSENSPASKFVRGSDEQTLLSSASSARTSNSSIPDSKSDVSALFNYGSQPVEHMRSAQRCLDVVSGDNLARQTLRDIELWIRESYGADAEAAPSPWDCGGSICIVCRLYRRIHDGGAISRCVRFRGCFGCGVHGHQRPRCPIVRQTIKATGVCYVCALPHINRGAHLDMRGRPNPPGTPCCSYAKDALLPACLLLFTEARSVPGNPALGIDDLAQFYLWLYTTDPGQLLPNSVRLFHWACSQWLKLFVCS